jgi:hypothetical protein
MASWPAAAPTASNAGWPARTGRTPSPRSMRITHCGGLPSIAKRASNPGSTVMRALPFTRSVSPTPGIRNSSATRGSATMLRRLSMRLLPRRSGMSSVFSSSTATNPADRRAATRRARRAQRGQHREGRRGNQRLVGRVQVRDLLLQRGLAGLAEQGFEFATVSMAWAVMRGCHVLRSWTLTEGCAALQPQASAASASSVAATP